MTPPENAGPPGRLTLVCPSAVTCVIMQKNGAGLHTASSCFWDSNTDGKVGFPGLGVPTPTAPALTPSPLPPTGSCTVRWENKTMYCIVSAFGLSI